MFDSATRNLRKMCGWRHWPQTEANIVYLHLLILAVKCITSQGNVLAPQTFTRSQIMCLLTCKNARSSVLVHLYCQFHIRSGQYLKTMSDAALHASHNQFHCVCVSASICPTRSTRQTTILPYLWYCQHKSYFTVNYMDYACHL